MRLMVKLVGKILQYLFNPVEVYISNFEKMNGFLQSPILNTNTEVLWEGYKYSNSRNYKVGRTMKIETRISGLFFKKYEIFKNGREGI